MAIETVEQELVALERRFWQAMKDKDVEAAIHLTDEPCLITGAQGVGSVDHQAFAGMMQSASWTLHEFEIGDDVRVRMLGGDVAITAYTVTERLTVDGKPVMLRAADSSTWVRRNGRWLCALHTEALAGDPFGRDHQAIE